MSTLGSHPRLTEARNPRTMAIDRADAETIVRLIQSEDRAVPQAVASQAAVIARVVDEVSARFRRGGRLIYVGAGTSGRLGTLDAAECPPTFGVDASVVRGVIAGGPAALVRSSEGAEDVPEGGADAIRELDVGPADFVLGIATSGTTPYVHGALIEAVARGAETGFLCCSRPPREIVDLVDHLILPLVGPEVIAGSTRMKAGTATKLVLNTITTGAMIRSGRIYENLMVDLRARSAKLVDRGIRIVVALTDLSRSGARALLIAAGGGAKTALAMHLLQVDRAMAERLLDSVGGFLGDAVERFGGGPRPVYAGYPQAPGWPDAEGLVTRLANAPRLLAVARREGEATEASGARVRLDSAAWTPGQQVAHMLEFERGAVRPRVTGWLAGSGGGGALVSFPDWKPGPPAPRDIGFEAALASFAEERAATVAAISLPAETPLSRRARVGSETLTLYQFLRGIAQHDQAHEVRIRERVHPALLQGDDA